MKKMTPLILTILMLSSFSYAKPGEGRRGGMMKALKQLNLSDAQKEKLKAARAESKGKKDRSEKKQVRELHQKMKELFASNAPQSELKAVHEKINSFRKQRDEQRFQKLMAVREILTLEQRKKFQEIMDEKRMKRRDRRKND